jgi:hypothetical protein
VLFHDLRRRRLQDRIGVIADKLEDVAGAVRPARPVDAVGPDGIGSKPGIEWFQTPEKSGTLPGLPPWGGPAVGTTVCAEASVAVAAASVTTKRKSRRCTFMISSSSLAYPVKAYAALLTPVKRVTNAIVAVIDVIGIGPTGTITRA